MSTASYIGLDSADEIWKLSLSFASGESLMTLPQLPMTNFIAVITLRRLNWAEWAVVQMHIILIQCWCAYVKMFLFSLNFACLGLSVVSFFYTINWCKFQNCQWWVIVSITQSPHTGGSTTRTTFQWFIFMCTCFITHIVL